MNVYIVEYESPANAFRGFVVVEAKDLHQARTKFYNWLEQQPAYDHLWQLSYKIIGNNHCPFTVI